MARRARFSGLLLALCLGTYVSSAAAQKDDDFSLDDEEGSGAASGSAPAAEEEEKEAVLLTDEQALEEERAPQEQYRSGTDPYEDPSKGYFFAGAMWRYARMPSWILESGLEAAPSIGSAGSIFGEFAYRKDGFQVAADVGWMDWSFKGPFQLAGDPPTDTEWLDGDFNLLSLSSTLTWSTSFAPWLSLDYGLEAGLAFIFGDLTRSEAYKINGKWGRCEGINNPSTFEDYCEATIPEDDTNGDGVVNGMDMAPLVTNSADELGAQYGVKAEKGLFNKGVPRVLPIVGPRLALRFKPWHQLVIRADVPLPLFPFGFWVGGLAAQYGF